MPHTNAFHPWTQRRQALFPDLKPHHRKAPAQYSFGMPLARGCGLPSVVAYLGAFRAVPTHALRQRLRAFDQPARRQRGCARSEFDYSLCLGPLLRWAAGHKDQRSVLALDPPCRTDRFRVLCAAVLYWGCGLPVAWAAQAADQKGSWNDIGKRLRGQLREALGAGWTVLVWIDRGLGSPERFRASTPFGWHPLIRVQAGGQFWPEGWHRGHSLHGFTAAVGRRRAGGDVAYPSGSALACMLLASWEEGHAEPWLLRTDLPVAAAAPAWYA